MTVSFVLNNKEGEVSEETRERVLRAVRELGYRPSARRTSGDRQFFTLGVVAGVSGHSLLEPGYYGSILHAILVAADDQNHNFTLFANSLMHSDTRQSIRIYCDGRCDGLLVIAPHLGSPLVQALRERGIPAVLIGDSGDDDGCSYVDIDNVEEGRAMARYLVGKGHRRIAFVGGPSFVRSAENRYRGFTEELTALGLADDASLFSRDIQREADAHGVVTSMMCRQEQSRPTAIFCWNDTAAKVAVSAIRRLDLAVPRDVSVVGFDDLHSDSTDPPLTTVRQPYTYMGNSAVEMLVAQIRHGSQRVSRLLVRGELIDRGSVALPVTCER